MEIVKGGWQRAAQVLIAAVFIELTCASGAPGCLSPPAGLISWWKGEGNALDQMNTNHGTISGNVTFGPAEVGQGFVIDGTGPLVVITNTTKLQFQNMTIEVWLRRASTAVASRDGNGNGHIFGFGEGGYTLYMDPAGHPSYGKTGFSAITCTATINDTNWHHVVVTKSGPTNVFYVDGVSFPGPTYDPGFVFSGPVYIGGVASNANFYGSVDEVSAYNRALSASEVQSIYNANVAGKCTSNPPPGCIPTSPGLVSWWRAEGNGLDQAGLNNGTLAGNTTFGTGRVGQAFVFDGGGDGVNVGNPANLQLQTFTIEAWVKRSDASRASLDPYQSGGIFISSWGGYGFGLWDDGRPFLTKVGYDNISPTFAITDTNTFHHVAVTKSGTNVMFYLDGVAQAVGPYTSTFEFGGPAAIGARGGDYVGSLLGSIDEVSIYNRALLSTEVQSIYNVGSAGKCLPSLPTNCVPSPSGLVSLWKAEGNASDSVGGNNGVITGAITFGSGEVGQAFDFDGVTGAVIVPASSNLAVQNLTIEGWIMPSSVSEERPIVEFSAPSGEPSRLHLWYSVGNAGTLYGLIRDPGGANLEVVSPGGLVVSNQWNHVAMTFDRAGKKAWLYLNGVNVASNSSPVAIQPQLNVPVNLGLRPEGSADIPQGRRHIGKMDEMSIYNRALSGSELQTIFNAASAGKCVPAIAPTITSQPTSQTTTAGSTAAFNVSAAGSLPLTYQWRFNGTNINGATTASLTLTNVQMVNAGNYSVLVTNPAGMILSSNAALVLTAPPACSPPPPGLVGWWKADGSPLDQTGANNGTLAGNTTYSPGRVGQAFAFDGNGDGVLIGNPAALQLQNFTIETWIKRSSTSTVSFGTAGIGVIVGYGLSGYALALFPNGVPFLTQVGAGNTSPSKAITDTNFHHLAVTKSGNTIVFYVDGIAYSAPNYDPGFVFSTPLAIGAKGDGFDNSFLGAVDEASIYNRALSGSEITAIYNANSSGKCTSSNPTNCAPPGIISWWPGEGNPSDVIDGNSGTIYGGVTFTNGVVGQAFKLNGSNGHIRISDRPNLRFANGLTLEAWINPVLGIGTHQAVIGKWDNFFGPGTQKTFSFSLNTEGLLYLYVSGDGSDSVTGFAISSNSVAPGQWNHVAGTYDGSSVRVYINGILQGQGAYNQGIFAGTNDMAIGGVVGGSPPGEVTTPFVGSIDEPAVYNRGLSATEIQAIYAAGAAGKCSAISSNCTPPPSDLVSWWKGDGTTLDQVGGNNGTLIGPVTYVPGRVGQAFAFDSSGEALALSNRTTLQLQNFTIEGWIKRSSTNRVSFDFNGGEFFSYGTGGYVFGLKDDGHPFLSRVGISEVISGQSISDLALHHVAVTKNATNVVFYVDGVAYVASPFTDTFTFETSPAIGARGDNFQNSFLGVIDELSIYRRALAGNEIQGIYSAGASGKCLSPPSTNCSPSPAGLVSWWKGDSTTLDQVGGNNGALIGGATYATGRVAQAFMFGGGSYFSAGSPGSLRFSNNVSIAAWIFPTGAGQDPVYGGIIVNREGEYELARFANGNIGWAFAQGPTWQWTSSGGIAPLNQWTHVALTFSSGLVSTYINGQLVQSVSGNGTIGDIYPDLNEFRIGSRPSSDQGFAGLVDEVAIFNRAITPNEVAGIYTAGSAGMCIPAIPPFIVSQPAGQMVSVGGNANFSVTAAGTVPLLYQWTLNGTNLAAATRSSLSISNVQFSQAGNYAVKVTNTFGSILSSSALLTVVGNGTNCASQSPGLISWWPGQGNASDVIDGNSGTIYGGVTFTNGIVGQAFKLNGSTGHIRIADRPNLRFTSGLTLEAWINPILGIGTHQAVIGKWDNFLGPGNQKTFSFSLNTEGLLYLYVSGDGSDSVTGFAISSNSIAPGQWSHVAGTYDGSSVRVYVNGILQGQGAYNQGIFAGTNDMAIGGVVGGSPPGEVTTPFVGSIDEPAVYNRGLSAAEIFAIYNAGSLGKCSFGSGTPPSIVAQPQSLAVNQGATANFTVTAIGTVPLTYQWSFNGTNLASATASSLSIPNVQPTQAGNYAVRVTNAFGAIMSSNAVLAVNSINPTNCVTPPLGLISWWPGEGNANDVVDANSGTFYGGVTFTNGIVGQAFKLNGTTGHIRIADRPNLHFANGLTLEAWINPVLGIGRHQAVIGKWDNLFPGSQKTFSFSLTEAGLLYLHLSATGTDSVTGTAISSNSLAPGQWSHVAGTYDGSSVRVYVNGVLQGQAAFTQGIFPGTNDMAIGGVVGGSAPGDVTTPFVGAIDEPSIYNRGLSAAEILALYNAASAGKCPGGSRNCVPPPPNMISWWRANGNGNDSVNGNNATLFNGAGFTNGTVGAAFNLDGADDLILVSNSPSLNFGPGQNFTIEGWIRPLPALTAYDNMDIVDKRGNGQGYEFVLHAGSVACRLSSHDFRSSGPDMRDGRFHHVALTVSRNSTTGGRMYQDGQLVLTFDPTTEAGDLSNTEPLRIGSNAEGVPSSFKGQIDELALYGRELSSSEIQAIYNAQSAGKCAGDNCLPPPPNTISWWKADGNGNDSVGGNNATLLNGTGFTNGFVGLAFNLDGQNDLIIVSNAPSLNFGSNQNFSIEAWIRPLPSITDYDLMSIVDKRVAPDLSHCLGYEFVLHAGSVAVRMSDSIADNGHDFRSEGPDMRDGNFHHVALTVSRNSTNGGRLYQDGQLVLTFDPTGDAGNLSNEGPLRIGNNAAPVFSLFKGQIDEVTLYARNLGGDEIRSIYLAGSSGKCGGTGTPIRPFIITQPGNLAVTSGESATFTVVAGGSAPLSYQWRFNETNISGATSSSYTISNAQFVNGGLYSVRITNSAGSILSSNALLTVTPGPTLLQVGNVSAASGATVTVPILLTANGLESAMQFSLSYNTSKLSYVNTVLANGSGATLLLNESGTSTGRVGLVIGLPTGGTFAPGTQQLAEVTFRAAIVTEGATTPVNFVDQPLVRQVSDQDGNPLAATYANGTVSIAGVAYEADVSPRPLGDKTVTVTDWVLIGRFAAHLIAPMNSSEFQRADCAPRATLGNGVISITDWVQAGRYAALLDPLTPVGGPTGPGAAHANSVSLKSNGLKPLSTRQLRVMDSKLNQGQSGVVTVSLQSQGNENALGFSLTFDPALLTYTGATLGHGAAGAILNVNTDNLASGQLGLALALPTGAHFAAGLNEVLQVAFQASTSATGTVSVDFADLPIDREVSDPTANALSSDYLVGTITINPLPLLTIMQAGQNISLAWPAWATNFVLQENGSDLNSSGSWSNVNAPVTMTNSHSGVTLPANGSTKFYRLFKP